MTRAAKLFYLSHKDIDPLKEIIKENSDYTFVHQIAIFKVNVDYHRYLVLSISDKMDNAISAYGCIEADKKDLWIRDFKETDCSFIYGNEILPNFLQYS